MGETYDPRAIANLMLNEADRRGIEISNLALQKMLYFAHGIFLTQKRRPLVSGYFEAWKYGPVHPAVYRAFKDAGSGAIKTRAVAKDPLTGRMSHLSLPNDVEVEDVVRNVVIFFGPLSPARLVDLSHAKGSPWDVVVDKARTEVAFGMRIPDNVIVDRFQHHKVSINTNPRAGEPPSEDTPFA
jgi:uncharacterized phage-associated protein